MPKLTLPSGRTLLVNFEQVEKRMLDRKLDPESPFDGASVIRDLLDVLRLFGLDERSLVGDVTYVAGCFREWQDKEQP